WGKPVQALGDGCKSRPAVATGDPVGAREPTAAGRAVDPVTPGPRPARAGQSGADGESPDGRGRTAAPRAPRRAAPRGRSPLAEREKAERRVAATPTTGPSGTGARDARFLRRAVALGALGRRRTAP